MIFYVGFAIPKQCNLCEVETRFESHYLHWLTLKAEKRGGNIFGPPYNTIIQLNYETAIIFISQHT